jgi:purine-binding chemotaxis protein CheW
MPLAHVVEIMRPLPFEPVRGMPPYLRGLSIVRGVPAPVVDAGMLLGTDGVASRWVSLRDGERILALGVEAVEGLADLDPESMLEWPSLLSEASAEVISRIGARDTHVLLVLGAARILSESDWRALAAPAGAS